MADNEDDRDQGAVIANYMREKIIRDGELASLKLHHAQMANLLSYIPTTNNCYNDEREVGRLLLLYMREKLEQHGSDAEVTLHSMQMRAIIKLAPISESAKPTPGKYFYGMHNGVMRTGVIVSAVGTTHFIVRFDDVAILPIGTMTDWTFADEAYERDLLELPDGPDEGLRQ